MSLLYVSRSTLNSIERDREINAVLDVSRSRNAALGITGALLATKVHFAQQLEGPDAAVDQVMASIVRDPRHTNITIVDRRPEAQRCFGDWSMAFLGTSYQAEYLIASLFESGGNAHNNDVEGILTLMRHAPKIAG